MPSDPLSFIFQVETREGVIRAWASGLRNSQEQLIFENKRMYLTVGVYLFLAHGAEEFESTTRELPAGENCQCAC